MKKFVLLKLLGLTVLTMVLLVALSFLEVAVYSYLIHPNQDPSVYDAHANHSAPYISGIFGFVLFFLVARYWKKHYVNALKLSLLFPLVYVCFDVALITAAGVHWPDFITIFFLANSAKFLGSVSGNLLPV
jgi:hypothetical protein